MPETTLASRKAVPLSAPDITEAEIEAVVSVLRTDRLSLGPRLEAFEAACAAAAGRRHGVGVNSGTSGLHLCVKALGIGAGDEVVTTPFTFIATTNSILFEGAQPVFADIDPGSYNLDPSALEAALTPRTKAIMPVEVFGNTAHFDAYERIARGRGLRMIEDCCEAMGGRLGGRHAGSFGDCGVFAFYPNKQVTTGEGGMIVTDSEDLRDLCRSLRNQGRGAEGWLAHARLGYNYRLSELAAALGAAQMRRLDAILAGRRRVAAMYHEALSGIDGLHLPPMAEPDRASWFVYVVRLADDRAAADRDAVIERLRADGIECGSYFAPVHAQPHVMAAAGTRAGQFPVAERIAARTIALPFHANLDAAAVGRVAEALADAIGARG